MVETSGSFPAAQLSGTRKGQSKVKDVSPRKSMAMGDGFPTGLAAAVDPYPGAGSDMMKHPDADMDTSKLMADGNRAHPGPSGGVGRGRMSSMGDDAVDHGPHNMPAGTNGTMPRGRGKK